MANPSTCTQQASPQNDTPFKSVKITGSAGGRVATEPNPPDTGGPRGKSARIGAAAMACFAPCRGISSGWKGRNRTQSTGHRRTHVSTVAFQLSTKRTIDVPGLRPFCSSSTMQAPDVSWTSCGLDADNRRAGPVDEIMSAAAALTSSALCQRLFRNPSLRGAKGHLHHVGGPPSVHQHQSNLPLITARRTEQVCGMPLRCLANESAVILLLAALPHQLM